MSMRDGRILQSAPTGAHDSSTMGLTLVPESWTRGALCAETDPETFFPEQGGTTKPAKRICERCDVVEECLAYALRTGQDDGVWGGKSRNELRALRRGAVAA